MRIKIRNTAMYEYLHSKFDKCFFIEQVSFFVENFSSSENEELEDPLDTAVGILPEIRFRICGYIRIDALIPNEKLFS